MPGNSSLWRERSKKREQRSYNGRMNIGVRSFSGGMASCRFTMVDTSMYSHSNFFLYIYNDRMMQDRASIMGIYSFIMPIA